MSDLDYDAAVKQMTRKKLIEWTAGNKPDSYPHMVGLLELERRKHRWIELRAWLALGISIAAFAVSLSAYMRRP